MGSCLLFFDVLFFVGVRMNLFACVLMYCMLLGLLISGSSQCQSYMSESFQLESNNK